jgi:hypothetical protein
LAKTQNSSLDLFGIGSGDYPTTLGLPAFYDRSCILFSKFVNCGCDPWLTLALNLWRKYRLYFIFFKKDDHHKSKFDTFLKDNLEAKY